MYFQTCKIQVTIEAIEDARRLGSSNRGSRGKDERTQGEKVRELDSARLSHAGAVTYVNFPSPKMPCRVFETGTGKGSHRIGECTKVVGR